jgi:hypothetical protein
MKTDNDEAADVEIDVNVDVGREKKKDLVELDELEVVGNR